MAKTKQKLPAIEYESVVKVLPNGALPFPEVVRKSLGVKRGSPLSLLKIGEVVIFIPQKSVLDSAVENIEKLMKEAGVTYADVMSELRQVRKRLVRRRYGYLTQD